MDVAPRAADAVHLVPLSDIDAEATFFRFRLDLGTAALHALAADLQENGQIHPVLLRPRPSGKLEIVCGYRRVAALRRIGAPHVRAVIRRLDDAAAFRLSWAENEVRQDLTDLDRGNAVLKARTAGHTMTELAAIFGRSRRHLSRWLHLVTDAPDMLLRGLEMGKLTTTHVIAILAAKGRHGDLDVRAWVIRTAEEGLSVAQLEAALKADEQRTVTRTGRPRRHDFFTHQDDRLTLRARSYDMTKLPDADLTRLLHQVSSLCEVLEHEVNARQATTDRE